MACYFWRQYLIYHYCKLHILPGSSFLHICGGGPPVTILVAFAMSTSVWFSGFKYSFWSPHRVLFFVACMFTLYIILESVTQMARDKVVCRISSQAWNSESSYLHKEGEAMSLQLPTPGSIPPSRLSSCSIITANVPLRWEQIMPTLGELRKQNWSLFILRGLEESGEDEQTMRLLLDESI